jgi:serine/threonine protein kinase
VVDHIGEGTKFGRYALLQKIGVGGMAEIYRAKTFGAAGFEKEFAIKLILPSLVDDHEFVEMFINEAKIAVSLYHANVVQVFDLGEIEGQYYIAMEYVRGKDLLEVLARCAERNLKIPLNLVLFIAMEMLKGLSFAHRASDPYGEDLNIIHRDVSPSNIMMSYAGDVKVGDFGVAKAAIQRTLTESGTLKGKVGYMSPEQVMGETIDARSDVFAAGVVFFEALSMSRLFVGNSDLEVMLQVRDANIADRLEKAEPMPAGLREIVEKALAKHREERYQTSGEFYQALVDFSYRYSIKVTDSDLSNFMRRLSSEEIEEEKAKRRAEPRVDSLLAGAAQAAKIKSASAKAGGRSSRQIVDDMPMSEAQESVDESSAGKTARADSIAGESLEGPALEAPSLGADFYDPVEVDSSGADHEELEDDAWLKRPRRGIDDTVRTPAALDTEPIEEGASEPMNSTVDEATEAENRARNKSGKKVGLSGIIPRTIPFEISSSVFDPSEELNEKSPVHVDTPNLDQLVDETTTAEFHRSAQDAQSGLRRQYASYEGVLGQVPFARILARLHLSSATGRLHVQSGSIEKSIFMRKGEPILINTNKKAERLGAFSLRRNRITEAQLEEALTRLDEWGGRLGDALVAIGAIEAHEIFELLSEQMREKLLDIFTWPSGRYGYYENQEPSTMGYPLGIDTFSTIVQACREDIPLELIHRFYEGREHVSIFKPSATPVDVERLKLSARELRIITGLNAGTNLQTLLAQIGEERRELALRTVYLLHQVEVLKFETTDHVDLPAP